MRAGQRAKAERFLALHRGPPILLLANAWDVMSACVFASQPRCRAIATTSSGVAAALGYPDGEVISREEMVDAVGRVARAVSLPVTADLEAGYGDPGGTAAAAIEAGAVGMNLEDGSGPPEQPLVTVEDHVAAIADVRSAAAAADLPFVLNARTDAYLRTVGDEAERFETTVERAGAYRRAGADCIFVPGVGDAESIGRLAEAIDAPLNVLATADTPPAAELERLGVRRVSIASAGMRASAALVARVGRELFEQGTFQFARDAMPYPKLLELFENPPDQD